MDTKFSGHLDMELELLGMLLLKEGTAVPKVAAILKPDDFYSYEHQLIYTAILDLHKHGTAPTMSLIADWLHRNGYIFRDGDDKPPSPHDKVHINTIMDLGQVAFTTAFVESYALKLKEASNRDKLIRLGETIKENAGDLTKDFSELVTNAENAFRDITNGTSPLQYIDKQFYFEKFYEQETKNLKLYSQRKTGFYNIDNNQILTPGLYVIGATPAAGKTTFCWQLLEQLHANGESCFFCSYEMSALELYAKSMSREIFLRDKNTNLTSTNIRCGASSSTLIEVLADFLKDDTGGVKLFILRDETIDDLLRTLKPLCTDKNKSPVVCLDYLQIIPPSNNIQSDKMRIDDIVHKLKNFQRETNTTFIVVSSFNRLNYYQQVSFESFKESGNIEYTADVVWALQLNVCNDIKIGATVSETRKKFEDAKRQQPRYIQLQCLKNRQGQNYDCFFKYYSAHDYFEPCEAANFTDIPASDEMNIPNSNGDE